MFASHFVSMIYAFKLDRIFDSIFRGGDCCEEERATLYDERGPLCVQYIVEEVYVCSS